MYPKDVGRHLEERGERQRFLHTDLVTNEGEMYIMPHSHNADFAKGKTKTQKLTRLVPPFNAPFDDRKAFTPFVAQMLARFKQTYPRDTTLCEEAMADMIHELLNLGCSYRQISAAVRSQKRNRKLSI